jgi:hypothetical protein
MVDEKNNEMLSNPPNGQASPKSCKLAPEITRWSCTRLEDAGLQLSKISLGYM